MSDRVKTPAAVIEQCRHQVRLTRQRMTWWIPLIMLAGCVVSLLGFVATMAESRERGSVTVGVFVFGAFALLFGWAVLSWLFLPLLTRPRVVPYFTRALGEYGGSTTAAFRRGLSLYRQIGTLDALAGRLGVTPLSAFGYAYDYYGQQVDWHRASAGLESVLALHRSLAEHTGSLPEVLMDLDALASVLRVAGEQDIEFSLVIRLHARESLQMLATREERQGSFW